MVLNSREENGAELLESMDLNFAVELGANEGGCTRELVEDGANIAVTPSNVYDYVKKYAELRMIGVCSEPLHVSCVANLSIFFFLSHFPVTPLHLCHFSLPTHTAHCSFVSLMLGCLVFPLLPSLQEMRIGLQEVVPKIMLLSLSAEDVRLMLCGSQYIEVDVLRSITVFDDESRK